MNIHDATEQAFKNGYEKGKADAVKVNRESAEKFFPKREIDIEILGYQSPIEICIGQMRMEQENNIFKAIQDYGVSVDKEELIKALEYDRRQYEQGYVCGYNKAMSEIVRCKDCKHYQYDAIFLQGWCNGRRVEKDDFCSYGERKEQ